MNPRTISIFCPRSSQTGREKNLENSPRKKIVPKKKQQNSTRKKKFFAREKYFKFSRPNGKNTLKFMNFCPRKKKNHPEKKIENVPEKTSDCPRKIKKSGREKNQEKYQKTFCRALSIFSGKIVHVKK